MYIAATVNAEVFKWALLLLEHSDLDMFLTKGVLNVSEELCPIYVTCLILRDTGLWLNRSPAPFLPTTRLLISLNFFLF